MDDNSNNKNDNDKEQNIDNPTNGDDENKEFNSRQFYLIVIATVTILMLASTINNLLIQQESNQTIARSQIKDQSLVFFNKKVKDGGDMFVVSSNILEACIRLKSVYKNTVSDITSPEVFDVQLTPDKPLRLAHYKIINKDKDWHYDYKTSWLPGNRGGNPNLDHVYSLPFEKGLKVKISQGAHGKFSHNSECDSFAIDFGVPVGTTVCCARGGKVIAIRSDSNLKGETKEFAPAANYIVIKHDDGSYAQYFHLKKGSEKISLGREVKTGDPIALSGNTGWTDGPHLHFAVFKIVDSETDITNHSVPVKFKTSAGIVENLEVGKTYEHPDS